MHRLTLLGLLVLAGCQAVQTARLPNDAVTDGVADPDRVVIINTSNAFSAPSVLAGRPADAARAAANLEYLAVAVPTDPRFTTMNPTVGLSLARGRDEMRNALGIARDAPPQPVIDRLYGASRALAANDRAAAESILGVPPFTAGGAATLARLGALPALPRANEAGVMALEEMWRLQREGLESGGGEGGGAHP